jgi:hypothetical protein
MSTLAYKLHPNLDHLYAPNAPKHDANLVVAPQWKELSSLFWDPKPIETLEPIVLRGHDAIISTTDYPYTMPTLPIMSQQMLETLLRVGDFPYQILPVEIVSFEDVNVVYRQFVAVQLLEHLDVFDWVNSVYELDEHFPGELGDIEKLVLREPSEGFPPIFRVKKKETLLYVSAKARAALEQAEIKGVAFKNLTYSA